MIPNSRCASPTERRNPLGEPKGKDSGDARLRRMISAPRKRKFPAPAARGVAASLWLALAFAFASPALAQSEGELIQRRAESQRELSKIRSEIELGESRRKELAEEIGRLEKDRASLNQGLLESSARSRGIEGRISRSGERLALLRGRSEALRRSLEGRSEILAEVLVALQRMGRNPPPALLASPTDALGAVRSAILLGAAIPEIRAETLALLGELEALDRIEQETQTRRASLTQELESLAEEEARLNLLLAEKRKLSAQARGERAQVSARAAQLAAEQATLGELIGAMEREASSAQAQAERREREARQIATARRELNDSDSPDPGRLTPSAPFERARGSLPKPVAGERIRAFGEPDELGEPSAGVSFATLVNALVSSPADGWVAYAGPWLSYGQVLILGVGAGYHIVLAGMESLHVDQGQFVLAGEPVGRMGKPPRQAASYAGVDISLPALYVEFRKDERAIDPAPWWEPESGNPLAGEPLAGDRQAGGQRAGSPLVGGPLAGGQQARENSDDS